MLFSRCVSQSKRAMLNYQGFSLMELMVTLVIMGVIAGFAVPNYQNTVARAREDDAASNLELMHAAQSIYFSRQDVYFPEDVSGGGNMGIADINANLNLSLNETMFDYTCGGTLATTPYCFARSDSGYELRTELNIPLGANNPCCSIATCPSLPAC